MLTNSISLILNVYNEVELARGTILSFKKYHPNSSVIVSGSENLSLLRLSEDFLIQTVHTNQYMEPLNEILKEKFTADLDRKIDCILAQLTNLQKSFQLVQTEYSYYLHPDHRVVKYFDFKSAKYDLEIQKSNRISEKELDVLKNFFPDQTVIPYYGIWGYFRTEAMLKTLSYLLNENIVRSLLMASDLFIYDDLLIPTIMQCLGFKVGDQTITCELRRKTSWYRKRKAVLIHHYA